MSLTDVDWSLIPEPVDDGKANHLEGMKVADISLPSTDGGSENLRSIRGYSVLYAYPMTGRPDQDLPEGWDEIPGARGCTPQSCAFRDHFKQLRGYGVDHVFGLSAQDTDYQAEAVERLNLPYPLLSDADGAFATAMNLPQMEVDGKPLLKRVTMIIRDGEIAKVNYPVFPPDQDPADVIEWLAQNGT